MSDYAESVGAYPPMLTTEEVDAGVAALVKALAGKDIPAGNITVPGEVVRPGIQNPATSVPALWIDDEWIEIRPLVLAVLKAKR